MTTAAQAAHVRAVIAAVMGEPTEFDKIVLGLLGEVEGCPDCEATETLKADADALRAEPKPTRPHRRRPRAERAGQGDE